MKHKPQEEHENHERWLVSYADFITLLFAFFTVLYAISNADLEKSKKFEQSIREAFGVIKSNEGSDLGANNFPKSLDKGNVIEPPIKVFYNRNATSEQLQDALMMMIDQEISPEQRKEIGFEVLSDEEGVRIRLLAGKLFQEGSAKIQAASLKTLDAFSKIFKMTGRPLIIEGHTDDRPVKGQQYPSNWELAGARASTIARYLIKVHTIEAERLKVVSYADQRNLEKNDTEDHRARNRRIEIVISTK